MIQRIGYGVKQHSQQTCFILITLKQTQVKDIKEVEQQLAKLQKAANANFHLSNSNKPKNPAKPGLLSQQFDVMNNLNLKLIANSKSNKFYDLATTQLLNLLINKAE